MLEKIKMPRKKAVEQVSEPTKESAPEKPLKKDNEGTGVLLLLASFALITAFVLVVANDAIFSK